MSQIARRIEETSQVGEIRRNAVAMAAALQWNESDCGKVAVVATELATNILKHAARGAILLASLGRRDDPASEDAPGVEIIALDNGPGMKNLTEAMRDGHSTTGTSGTGLGAVSRMTEELEVYSPPGKGTALRCVVRREDDARARHAPHAAQPRWRVGSVTVPKPGETANGDAWHFLPAPGGCILLMMDGLGHGPDAAIASQAAIDSVRRSLQRHPMIGTVELMEDVHAALRPTRGAAGAIARIDLTRQTLSYCGVGNIASEVRRAGASHRLVSHNGILGHQTRRIQAMEYAFAQGATLIMHTDGLGTHWGLADYPGLEARHPALIAAVLYRDHVRGRDDATIAVLRPSTLAAAPVAAGAG